MPVASPSVSEIPVCNGLRKIVPTCSTCRHGPGMRKTAATDTTTRVLTQRGSRRRGGSLIISDTVAVRSVDPQVPYAELPTRSIPCLCHVRHNQADLPPGAPASLYGVTANQPNLVTANHRLPA